MSTAAPPSSIDPKSGFCSSTSTFYSKREPIPIPPNPILDITTFISSFQSHSHHATAFVDASTGDRLTYSELWLAVDAVSSTLSTTFGVCKGHVILILSPNSIFFPVICLSVMSLGAVITTANPINTGPEIAKQMADSKPFLTFTTPELLPKLAAGGGGVSVILITTDDDDEDPSSSNTSIYSNLKILATLSELMKTAPSQNRVKPRITQTDTASLLYSSGTTGESKGVISSHENLIAMVSAVNKRYTKSTTTQQQQIYICTVPMFHIFGMAIFAMGLLTTGSTIVILPKYELGDLFSAIERFKVSYFPLVPPILVAMVNRAAEIKGRYDLSSLKCVLSGGAPLGKEVVEGFVAAYPGVEITQGYGLTESAGMGASTEGLEETRRYGTAGLLNVDEGKIVDPESGKAMGVNQTGELWIRGPTVMKGYFGNLEATTATLTSDGWLKTGDLCYIDEEGFIFVVDRLKELIKFKGYQVAPAELESLLFTHPQIADVAVIPYPDAEVGQYPMAYVVKKPCGACLSETSIKEFVARQVAPYKRIRKVAFVDTIPKNPSGKILRKDLIKMTVSG